MLSVKGEQMNKNFAIAFGVATLVWLGSLYHTSKINALQAKYEKTCELSVKKSEKISQLVKELKTIKPKRVIIHP
tara:strand:- start:1583 stop:1807 length:225 start_codon:yes stop_codon:yes gene_type:complete